MHVHAGWLFLIPALFVVGLFIGERWAYWEERSRHRYMDKGVRLANLDLRRMREMPWFKRQAD